MFKGQSFCFTALLIRLVFIYFATMTYIHLTLAFISNPGYLPKWLKAPPTLNEKAHEAQLRIYNLRIWMANKIHTFEEFLEPSDEEDSAPSSPVVANNTIEEEIPSSRNINTIST